MLMIWISGTWTNRAVRIGGLAMAPQDFRCWFCGGVCRTVDWYDVWRERYTECTFCGIRMVMDWNPHKYRKRNVLYAEEMTRRGKRHDD